MCAAAFVSVCATTTPLSKSDSTEKKTKEKRKQTGLKLLSSLCLHPQSIICAAQRCREPRSRRRRPFQKQRLCNSHAAPRASTESDQRRWQCTFTSTSRRKGSETQIKVEVEKILWRLQPQSQRRRRGRKFDPIGVGVFFARNPFKAVPKVAACTFRPLKEQ